jgi:hypothetical protein
MFNFLRNNLHSDSHFTLPPAICEVPTSLHLPQYLLCLAFNDHHPSKREVISDVVLIFYFPND